MSTSRVLPVALAIGWAGLVVHDLLEFGALSVANAIPFGIGYFLVAAVSLARPGRKVTWAALALGLFAAVASAVSILPFDFWPWNPAQTLEHYAAHFVATVAQLPVIIIALRLLRGGASATPPGG